MGGDEFVILALNMDPASAGRLAEDLIEAIREPFRIDIHQLAISLSIGIAIYPNDGIDQDDLLTNADAAMPRQGHGPGHVLLLPVVDERQCASPAAAGAGHAPRAGKQRIAAALPAQFMAPDGPIIGVEALVRWHIPRWAC